MGRPKLISDVQLFSELDTFWIEVCHEVPGKLTSKSFSLHLQQNEYPVTDSSLRHNSKLMEKINLLKAKAKPVSTSSHEAAVPGTSDMELSYGELLKKYQEMQNFIYNTYVKGICCHLVNKELSTSIDSPVKEEVIKQNVISADMNPFTSPVVEKLAKLFDLETKDE